MIVSDSKKGSSKIEEREYMIFGIVFNKFVPWIRRIYSCPWKCW